MHDRFKMSQCRAKPAAGMKGAELPGIEALVFQQRDGNRIAQGKLE